MCEWKYSMTLHATWIEFKFNWREMRCKLVHKVLKICNRLKFLRTYCWFPWQQIYKCYFNLEGVLRHKLHLPSWFMVSCLYSFMDKNGHHPLWLHCIHIIKSTSMKLEAKVNKIKNVKESPTYVWILVHGGMEVQNFIYYDDSWYSHYIHEWKWPSSIMVTLHPYHQIHIHELCLSTLV